MDYVILSKSKIFKYLVCYGIWKLLFMAFSDFHLSFNLKKVPFIVLCSF